MKEKGSSLTTKEMVFGAILTALVVILQLMGAFVRLGPFSVSLVLVPIVIGAAICSVKVGAWLGFVFGAAVLLSGDAAAFLAVDIFGTIVTVLLKGTLAGLLASLTYKALKDANIYVAVVVAAIVCPVVNTGVFLIGCLVFFMDTVAMWAQSAGLGTNVGKYMIFGLVGANFLFELGMNIILSPVIVRLINIRKKQ